MEDNNIQDLKKQKQYNQIYKLYGSEKYLMNTPTKVLKQERKNLLEEGKFNEYYEKFGEEDYISHEKYIQKKDIERELGIHIHLFNMPLLGRLERTKLFRKPLLQGGLLIVSTFLMLLLQFQTFTTMMVKENEKEYAECIDEYNKEINQYASYMKGLNLSDFEIALKVMSDMWANIDGYKTPTDFDEMGVFRLSLYENGFGVCRNMADDYTARMNAINPEFDAKNLVVYIDSAEINDIKRNILQEEETVFVADNTNKRGKMFGNHLVSCIRLKEEGITLIVDPTNPSIGIFKNGKIYMLSKTKMGIKLPKLNQSIYDYSYQIGSLKEILQSFLVNGSYEEYMEKYGIASQNEILKDIQKLESSHYHIK